MKSQAVGHVRLTQLNPWQLNLLGRQLALFLNPGQVSSGYHSVMPGAP
jgi:hypothetical protein